MSLEKYFIEENPTFYREKTFSGTDEEYRAQLNNSCYLYVNNIDNSVEEYRLWELFGMIGPVKRIIMGINRNSLTFCGFCFVEYYTKEDAKKAKDYLDKFRLDRRTISIDKDMGFTEGRQYGRGVFGGRMKDDNAKKRRYYG
ncbi:Nuclear cap-binding protein subunit 2 [Nosema bombycis CQ1]|uniref:Nuclear cap-binding protein subunit 2 n=1 Tax=Nosema bombycis (strain CQ1 / CVCC 102059) TaxID=578461 RepID=R0M7A5_NOSB1|nr:Nuclear cap-binding protein subunit 2 [Nosema bombycis CQ1]|eukprot:EOB13859.1 Nuclear cap-binding protein subunit 2 [Nosema bombycis CQ1]